MVFIRWKFGPADDPGMGNFTLPFAGYVEKFRAAWPDGTGREASALGRATLAVVVALAVQWAFFILRWRPAERWWRVGVAFALMTAFLSTPVWEGFPGASTRVLLPMTLAFNVLVPRTRWWLPVLIAGNLTVAASVFEFSPPHEFYQVRGERALRSAVHFTTRGGWYGPERHLEQHWRWSSGRAELHVTNSSGAAIATTVRGVVTSADGARSIRVLGGERLLWGDTVGPGPADLRFGLVLPPGETVLVFTTDRPGQKIGADPRVLAFNVTNLDIVLAPADVRR
jgi:hypothetical protein